MHMTLASLALVGTFASAATLGGSDDCATPEPIAGAGVFDFDSSTATTGTVGQNEPTCKFFGSTTISNDVWFEWTANATGAARLSTCGTSVDTKIVAWPGIGCPIDGTSLSCNDDSCGLQSQMLWPVRAGETYLLQIGTFPGEPGGAGSFEIDTVPAGKLVTYEAGLAGLPPTAPDPSSGDWTLVDPSGGAVGVAEVSPDGATGLNAWQIDDDVSGVGGRAYYEQLLDPFEASAPWVAGFEFEAEFRYLGGAEDDFFVALDLLFPLGSSGPRYELVLRAKGPDLIATDTSDGGSYVLPDGNDGEYHRLVIRTLRTSFWLRPLLEFDDVAVTMLPIHFVATDPGVRWGASSDLATTTVNLHAIRLSLLEPVIEPLFGQIYCTAVTGTPCPCGNVADPFRGCANSTGLGGGVFFAGDPTIGSGNHRFEAFGLVPGQPALLFAGEEPVAGGDGARFGDGLRCAGTHVVRLGVDVADATGLARWGPDLETLGGWVAGDERYVQAWYRDPTGSPCGNGFNLSSGYQAVFYP